MQSMQGKAGGKLHQHQWLKRSGRAGGGSWANHGAPLPATTQAHRHALRPCTVRAQVCRRGAHTSEADCNLALYSEVLRSMGRRTARFRHITRNRGGSAWWQSALPAGEAAVTNHNDHHRQAAQTDNRHSKRYVTWPPPPPPPALPLPLPSPSGENGLWLLRRGESSYPAAAPVRCCASAFLPSSDNRHLPTPRFFTGEPWTAELVSLANHIQGGEQERKATGVRGRSCCWHLDLAQEQGGRHSVVLILRRALPAATTHSAVRVTAGTAGDIGAHSPTTGVEGAHSMASLDSHSRYAPRLVVPDHLTVTADASDACLPA